jgi:hypothetical protein
MTKVMGAAPEDVNEIIKFERNVERMRDDMVRGCMPGVAVAMLLNIAGNLSENVASIRRSDASYVNIDALPRAAAAAAGVLRPVTVQRIKAF